MTELHLSKRYDMPGQQMWERIGDPGKISEWHPAIEATEMLAANVRLMQSQGCPSIHHTYQIDESPLPVENLVGPIRVRDESDDACVVAWDATFEPAGIPEQEAVELVSGIFQTGLDAL